MSAKKIYAFDFDGTIVTNEFPEIGTPIKETIDLINCAKENGHYIILNTMRTGSYLDDAVEFCRKVGIDFDAVNDNLPHMKEFYKNNPRKIFANYYIDDHNLFLYPVNNRTNSTIRPYKFEDLHDFMAYHDKVLNKDCLIAQVCDKENISICWYEEENMLTEDWVEFEENRFYPVQYANEVQL